MKVTVLTEGSHGWSCQSIKSHWTSDWDCPMALRAEPIVQNCQLSVTWIYMPRICHCGSYCPDVNAMMLSLWHIWKFSCESHFRKPLSKENFHMWHTHLRKFLLDSDVFTCWFWWDCWLSKIERVLFLKVFFRTRWAVISQSETHDVIDWSFIVVVLCIITESRIRHWKSQKNIIVVVVVKLNLHLKYRSTHETPLLTCNFRVSTFKCVIVHLRKSLAQVFLRKLLALVTFARNFLMCHRLYTWHSKGEGLSMVCHCARPVSLRCTTLFEPTHQRLNAQMIIHSYFIGEATVMYCICIFMFVCMYVHTRTYDRNDSKLGAMLLLGRSSKSK